MKILGRIIIILIAALAVAGAAIALVGNSSARFPDDRTESRPLVRDQPGGVETDPEGLRPPDRFHEDGRDEPSLFGIVSVIQNFVIISLIVGVITLGSRLKRGLARLTGSFHNI